MSAALAEAASSTGRVDYVVNTAGLLDRQPLNVMDYDTVRKSILIAEVFDAHRCFGAFGIYAIDSDAAVKPLFGLLDRQPLNVMDYDTVRKSIDVNYLGCVNVAKESYPCRRI